MSHSKIRVESYDARHKVLKVIPAESFDFNIDAEILHQTILNLAKIEQVKIVLDLRFVPYPTSSFIGFLVEATSLLKRKGGELIILNLLESARLNIVSFNPLSYLQIASTEGDIESFYQKDSAENELPNARAVSNVLSDLEGQLPDTEFNIKDLVSGASSGKNENDFPPNSPAEFDFADLVAEEPATIKEIKSDRIVVHSREDELYKLSDFVAMHAEKAGFDHTEVSRIKISVYEAAHNIIEHAYEFDSHKYIELSIKYDPQKFTITLVDKGKSFDYDPDRNYDAIEAVEERRTGGFGLHIIRRSMDEVEYESNPVWGNRLKLVKHIP